MVEPVAGLLGTLAVVVSVVITTIEVNDLVKGHLKLDVLVQSFH